MHCKTWSGKLRNGQGRVVLLGSQSRAFRTLHSAFYFPHYTFHISAFYRYPFYTGRLKNGADLVMGVCDFVRCGPITLVQSGCVWLGPHSTAGTLQYGPNLVLGISDLVWFTLIWSDLVIRVTGFDVKFGMGFSSPQGWGLWKGWHCSCCQKGLWFPY